jgi:hypothetical protein
LWWWRSLPCSLAENCVAIIREAEYGSFEFGSDLVSSQEPANIFSFEFVRGDLCAKRARSEKDRTPNLAFNRSGKINHPVMKCDTTAIPRENEVFRSHTMISQGERLQFTIDSCSRGCAVVGTASHGEQTAEQEGKAGADCVGATNAVVRRSTHRDCPQNPEISFYGMCGTLSSQSSNVLRS